MEELGVKTACAGISSKGYLSQSISTGFHSSANHSSQAPFSAAGLIRPRSPSTEMSAGFYEMNGDIVFMVDKGIRLCTS